MNFNINGFVDLSGEVISKNINGIIDIDDLVDPILTLNKNDNSFKLSENNDVFYELKKFNLTKDSDSLPNIKLQFIDDGTMKEEVMSDQNGDYWPLLDNGTYNVKINGSNLDLNLNQTIESNLPLNFFFIVEGLIEKKIGSTNYIHNSEYRMIVGELTNQNNRHNFYEIIVSNKDKLYTRFFTNLDGKYKFALKNGIYDIRIRSDKYFKLIKNAEFKEGIDFSDLIRGEANGY